MKYNILIFITLGFFLGVFVGSFNFLNFYTFLFLFAISFVVFLQTKNKNKIILFLIFVFLGFGRVFLADFLFVSDKSLLNQRDFSGVVYREPDKRTDKTLLYIEIQEPELKAEQKVLLFAPLYPEINVGDRVSFSGQFEFPEVFTSDDRLFDYPNFLKKEDVAFLMYKPTIKGIEENVCCSFKRAVIDFKEKFKNNLNEVIKSPESELLDGVLLGDKRSGGPEWLEKFRKTGLIHIMVLSGYNISIVSDFVLKFFGFLPGSLTLIATILLLFIFITAVGGSATVLRAGIMAMIAILARFLGRKYDVRIALFFAGFLMVLWNPFILAYDPAFQLSFLATFALIYLSPLLEVRFARFYPGKFTTLKSIIATTIIVQLFVTPHLLYLTGNLPIFSLPANILVLPLVPTVMLLGAIVGFIGFFGSIISFPVGVLTQILLSIILSIVNFLAFITPNIQIPSFPFWVVLIIYIGIFILWRYYLKKKTNAHP